MTAQWIEELIRPTFCEQEAEPEERAQWKRAAMREFEKSIPQPYRWARLKSALLVRAVKLAIPRELPTAKNVVFMGLPGIGKTNLAVALLRAMVERELEASVLASDDDAERIVRRYSFVHAHRIGVAHLKGPAGLAELEAAMRAPMVLLDDLDADAKVPSNAVPELIYQRHADALPTWFTTSLDKRGIAARYGGGIARRVLEHADVLLAQTAQTATGTSQRA